MKVRMPNVGPTTTAVYDEHLLEIVRAGLTATAHPHISDTFEESWNALQAWCDEFEESINGGKV